MPSWISGFTAALVDSKAKPVQCRLGFFIQFERHLREVRCSLSLALKCEVGPPTAGKPSHHRNVVYETSHLAPRTSHLHFAREAQRSSSIFKNDCPIPEIQHPPIKVRLHRAAEDLPFGRDLCARSSTPRRDG
jgi:hypothetical protein